MNKNSFIGLLLIVLSFILFQACKTGSKQIQPTEEITRYSPNIMPDSNLPKTEAEWQALLNPEEYYVLRQKGTERPRTGIYDQHWDSGTYVCKGCGTELFSSETKFDAHCGWPSFYAGINKSNIVEKADFSHGMSRIEVLCAHCGGHLGHVFNDGPKPTGLRYCINSVSLGFKKKD
jgi:peptide-methionine (R)-S-oxide reductase